MRSKEVDHVPRGTPLRRYIRSVLPSQDLRKMILMMMMMTRPPRAAIERKKHGFKSQDHILVLDSVTLSVGTPYVPTVLPTVGPMDLTTRGFILAIATNFFLTERHPAPQRRSTVWDARPAQVFGRAGAGVGQPRA